MCRRQPPGDELANLWHKLWRKTPAQHDGLLTRQHLFIKWHTVPMLPELLLRYAKAALRNNVLLIEIEVKVALLCL